jgi:hypothetical protein
MSDLASEQERVRVSEGEKIRILLAEYAALRDEVLQRDTSLNQFLMIGGLILVLVVGMIAIFSLVWLGSALILLLFALMYLTFKFIEHDVLMCAARLRAIEKEINLRAGEELLVWEATSGLQEIGYSNRFKYAGRAFASVFTFGLWPKSPLN